MRRNPLAPQFNMNRCAVMDRLRWRAAHVTHAHAGIRFRTPARRSEFADDFAIDDNAFATPHVVFGRFEHDGDQSLAQWLFANGEQRLLADEVARLVESDTGREPRFKRRFIRPQFRTPGAAAGIDTERIERVVAGVFQAKFAPGFVQGRIRKGFQETRKHPVMLDWSGKVCALLGYQKDMANLLVIDRNGAIRGRFTGPATPAALVEAGATLDAILSMPATTASTNTAR